MRTREFTSEDGTLKVECRPLKMKEIRQFVKMGDNEAGIESMYATIQSIRKDGSVVALDELDSDDIEEVAELIAPMFTRKN